MLQALLHGKLSREQENMEDILSSVVFGALEYLPGSFGLLPFLARSTDAAGNGPLQGVCHDSGVTYEFWPWWTAEGGTVCQPDVVIRIDEPSGGKWLLAIEAKYRSGKSSEADEGLRPNDQLAREWHLSTRKMSSTLHRKHLRIP